MVHATCADKRPHEVLVSADPVFHAPHEYWVGLCTDGIEEAELGLHEQKQARLEIEIPRALSVLSSKKPVDRFRWQSHRHAVRNHERARGYLPIRYIGMVEPPYH